MVRFQLGESLNAITAYKDLADTAFTQMERAEANGDIDELITG
jgi:hypothetical protein